MLKVTRLSRSVPALTVKLEGELREPWVALVRDVCTLRGRRSGRLLLNLVAVTYADAAGVDLLRELVSEGVEIAACSGFIGELLRPTSL